MMRTAIAVVLSGLLLSVMHGCHPADRSRSGDQTDSSAVSTDSTNGAVLDEQLPEIIGRNVQTSPPPPYAFQDTIRYETAISRSWAATLYEAGTLVDTVDAIFGVQRVGPDSVLFLPVSKGTSEPNEEWKGHRQYVLYTNGQRFPVAEKAPCFDDHFSSPWVLDETLYYWGLCEKQGSTQLYAMRYRFGASEPVDSLHVQSGVPASDYRFLLKPPRRENGVVIYEGERPVPHEEEKQRWTIDPKTFETVSNRATGKKGTDGG